MRDVATSCDDAPADGPKGCGRHEFAAWAMINFGARDPLVLAGFVADANGTTVQALLGRRRAPRLVTARRELYRKLRAWGWTYEAIGGFVGERDHATVMYALRGMA
jgi:hypothetical protein